MIFILWLIPVKLVFMTTQDIRKAYLEHFTNNNHAKIARALVVPQNDPTTLFTGSGMQPLIPYLLGEEHPSGTRLVNSQTCLRAQDIDEVGDNRHTTFFEMLGNWSLGDYFKEEQIPFVFEFLTDKIGLDPNRIYVSCFIGDEKNIIPKDTVSAEIWQKLFRGKDVEAKTMDMGTEADGARIGAQDGRIFFYSDKNWWCRGGSIDSMPEGEPGGPDTEMFYLFDFVKHNTEFGEKCHPNCDCGRYLEIGNSVFMEYVKSKDGFEKLPKHNVDFGGGLERIAAASIDSPDVFKISLLWPIIQKIEQLSGKKYDSHTQSMRIIADHLRASVFLAVDGVSPSNKEQGYVMRRLLRRAIMQAFNLGIEQNFLEEITPVITDLYKEDYAEVAKAEDQIITTLTKEEKIFKQTLRNGLKELKRISKENNGVITGANAFKLYDTFGYPLELTQEVVASLESTELEPDWKANYDSALEEQRQRSRSAVKGDFKGGLADHSEIVTKYHTATHIMYRALRNVLGEHVIQRGSNITAERLRFDFSHDGKVTPEQIKQVEDIVNEQIKKDWPMDWREEKTSDVLGKVLGAFGDRYGDTVKIYTIGDPDGENFSREICGGPHVKHTSLLADGDKVFKIKKEQASSSGVRRIKAIIV